MEREEINNEKSRLLESLKSDFEKEAKDNKNGGLIFIGFGVFMVIIGLINGTLLTAFNSFDRGPLILTGLVVGSLIRVFLDKKIKKFTDTDDAQEFLALYDKRMKIEKWIGIVLLFLLMAWVIFDNLNNPVADMLIIFGILAAIFLMGYVFSLIIYRRRRKEIKRLRELVQMS